CDRKTLQFYKVNKAAIEHYGYTKEEFLDLSVYDLRPKEDHEKLKRFAESDLTSLSNEGLRKHIKKNGEEIWVEIKLTDIVYKHHDAILVVINDVTEKIRSEEALRNSEELYRSLF